MGNPVRSGVEWGCSEAFLRGQAGRYKEAIREYCDVYSEWDYAEEIQAIAAGADVPPWKLYVVNARTEILTFLSTEARKRAAAKESKSSASRPTRSSRICTPFGSRLRRLCGGASSAWS